MKEEYLKEEYLKLTIVILTILYKNYSDIFLNVYKIKACDIELYNLHQIYFLYYFYYLYNFMTLVINKNKCINV